jgi:SAM-dependent methyltransferase
VGHQLTRAGDAAWRPEAEARLQLINRHCPDRGTLLDVGCSAGWFMGTAGASGWKVVGIDVSAAAVAHCRSQGFDARLATLSDHDLPAGGFQVITMFDSIEHMPSPAAALLASHALLAPNGILVITTPNIRGLFPRLTYALFGRTLGAWEHPGPPGHVYQFSNRTLAAALDRAGFSIIEDRTEAIPLEHTVGALEEALMDALKGRTKRPKAEIEETTPQPSVPAKKSPPRLLRRAVRGLVRSLAWLLAGAIAAPAPLFGAGDSLIVVARKRQ